MTAYVWARVENVTDSCHNEGGLLVIAATLESAREAIATRVGSWGGEPLDCEALTKMPDATYALAEGAEPKVWAFPDSGCC